MDANFVLVWFVCLSGVMFLFRTLRAGWKQNHGWIAIGGAVLAITLGLVYFAPTYAGFVGAILWAVFLFLPSLGFNLVDRFVTQQKYSQARRLASGLRWLHPADGKMSQPKLLRALELGHKGEIEGAIQILKQNEDYSHTAYKARAIAYSIEADWQACLRWMQKNVPDSILWADPDLIICYLRSLGETGNLNELLQQVKRTENLFKKTGNKTKLNFVRLLAFAFCGRTLQVENLLANALSLYPENICQFWLLTSQLSAGYHAKEKLLLLHQSADPVLGNAIEWRFVHPPTKFLGRLTDSSKQILARLQVETRQDISQNLTKIKGRKAFATYGLIAINLLVFALEIELGGSENLDTLYQLGALVPQTILAGEWWRIITANFLHYGWLHLLMNMIGLYFLGRPVEIVLGVGRYLIVYLVSGIGAMSVFALWAIKSNNFELILVGASAAIMGLVGVIGAIFLRNWYREKTRLAAKRLLFIILVVGIQFTFDFWFPQVSFLSHLFGLIFGFLTGILLLQSS